MTSALRMSDEKKQPLSLEGWIKLYTDEINRVKIGLSSTETAWVAIGIAFLTVLVAFILKIFDALDINSAISDISIQILLRFILLIPILLFLTWLVYMILYKRHEKKLTLLIPTREDIISGELADLEEIHTKWKAYIEKYYGKYLENSERNKAEDGLRDQKGDPQVTQSDIMHIKGSLQKIEDMLDKTKIFSVLTTLGSLLIAISIFMISLGTTLLLLKYYYVGSIVLLVGFIYLISGALMICSAEPYVGALKGLWHYNILFRRSIFALLIAILILVLANLSLLILKLLHISIFSLTTP